MDKKNKPKLFLIASLVMQLCCCEIPTQQSGEIKVLQERLIAKTKEIKTLEKQCYDINRKLIHVVYFNLKEGLQQKEILSFIEEMERLETIRSVDKLVFGKYQEVGDKRSMKEMDIVMQLTFEDVSALNEYQDDAIHLNVRENLIPYLEGAPKTYDFFAN